MTLHDSVVFFIKVGGVVVSGWCMCFLNQHQSQLLALEDDFLGMLVSFLVCQRWWSDPPLEKGGRSACYVWYHKWCLENNLKAKGRYATRTACFDWHHPSAPHSRLKLQNCNCSNFKSILKTLRGYVHHYWSLYWSSSMPHFFSYIDILHNKASDHSAHT